MTDDLKQLLGDGDAVAGEVARFTAPAEESPTVLVTDRWTKRAGERLAQQWVEAGMEEMAPVDSWPVAADAIETLLSPNPKPAERPIDTNRAQWWQQLMKSPECGALRARTVASPAVAEIAAAELAKQWTQYVAEHPEPTDPENESPEETVGRLRSTREAIQAASDAAEEAEAVGAGLGLGNGIGLDAPKLAEYTRRLRGHANLKNIMRMAGRFIAKAQRLQRQRSDLPGMEITGVELSGDLARLLPIESSLVAGAVPELETLALARLVQRRALSYRRITRTPVAMGPIVVSLDESASMDGERIEAAKGLCLAMASIARAQKRPFALSAFSGTPEIRVVSSPSPDAVIEWLTQFFGGGTSLEGPLYTLPSKAWPAGPVGARADHIIITDDDVGVNEKTLTEYHEWAKKLNVRTFGIGVGVRHVKTLARVCDAGVWTIPELDLDNPALDVILSIGPTHKDMV